MRNHWEQSLSLYLESEGSKKRESAREKEPTPFPRLMHWTPHRALGLTLEEGLRFPFQVFLPKPGKQELEQERSTPSFFFFFKCSDLQASESQPTLIGSAVCTCVP